MASHAIASITIRNSRCQMRPNKQELLRMYTLDRIFETEDIDPIDIVETLAAHYDWDFDRVTEDEISVAIEGSWRTYAVTFSWATFDETLRIISSFDMRPPNEKLESLNKAINLANSECWTGAFVFVPKKDLMIFRYGVNLIGGASLTATQIDSIVGNAVLACERFYPAFQLTCWGNESPEASMEVAFDQSFGRA